MFFDDEDEFEYKKQYNAQTRKEKIEKLLAEFPNRIPIVFQITKLYKNHSLYEHWKLEKTRYFITLRNINFITLSYN